jgi:hypothetical protein
LTGTPVNTNCPIITLLKYFAGSIIFPDYLL